MSLSFEGLNSRLPELAERDTGSVVLPSADDVSFIDLFCADKSCDCRRVVIHGDQIRTGRLLGTAH